MRQVFDAKFQLFNSGYTHRSLPRLAQIGRKTCPTQ
ncbi:hypothetical protein EcWSU1_03731 [Enterobacter ludwigii]|uniref:Uncharacterized protein n=1 Tax=Enterobacter ludwigii TaxID=299767 RepID=G8LDW6_9ENTR|nr:hypothetical protein EcWSU1_03731 [Enterobacter ludwigii]